MQHHTVLSYYSQFHRLFVIAEFVLVIFQSIMFVLIPVNKDQIYVATS